MSLWPWWPAPWCGYSWRSTSSGQSLPCFTWKDADNEVSREHVHNTSPVRPRCWEHMLIQTAATELRKKTAWIMEGWRKQQRRVQQVCSIQTYLVVMLWPDNTTLSRALKNWNYEKKWQLTQKKRGRKSCWFCCLSRAMITLWQCSYEEMMRKSDLCKNWWWSLCEIDGVLRQAELHYVSRLNADLRVVKQHNHDTISVR